MTPVEMRVDHEQPGSAYGDSMRACLATLLDIPLPTVDDFSDHEMGSLPHVDRVTAYLRSQGMYPIILRIDAEPSPDGHSWFDYLRGHYIVQGMTRTGLEHCVIATGRMTIEHDPHPSRQKELLPYDDGTYILWILARLL